MISRTCVCTRNLFILMLLVHVKNIWTDDNNVTCSLADTCTNRGTAGKMRALNCECSPSCARHRTCCIDSPYREVELPGTLEECTWVESINASVFMVSKCDPLWDGPLKTKELCEGDQTHQGDPLFLIPVTSTFSGVTYANIFCSICNGEHDGIVYWHFAITRNEFPKVNTRMCAGVFPRSLEYTNDTGKWMWGYWHQYKGGYSQQPNKKFITVDLRIEIPYDFRALVSHCVQDIVSECASDWDDAAVKRECESYMAAVDIPVNDSTDIGLPSCRTYRNVHCAVCNHVTNLMNATCKLPKISVPTIESTDESYRKKIYSTFDEITLYFAYQLPDISCVEHIAGIRSEPIESPKDCRTLVCDPGYNIDKGKCIPDIF